MTAANVDTLRDTASDAIDQLQGATVPKIEKGTRQAGVLLLDQSGELIDTLSSRASETVAELRKTVIAYTEKNPLVVLLLAVGAGALMVSAVKSIRSRY